MPHLAHNAEKERHLTLAALGHCPRHYWHVNEIRAGRKAEQPASTALTIGLLAHVGLKALWTQRQQGQKVWTPSLALDAMDTSPDGAASVVLTMLKDGPSAYQALRKGLVEYAAHWTGVRDDWQPLAVAPEDIPPQPWTVLAEKFVAYPDLLVTTSREAVLVVDHKTSAWRFEAPKWEWHPELLTQCLAAQQLRPEEPVYYQVDFLQKPGPRSGVWSFPVTPVWEFTTEKEAAAWEWLEHLLARLEDYQAVYRLNPWPRELSQCQQPWGMCSFYEECFGQHMTPEDLGG